MDKGIGNARIDVKWVDVWVGVVKWVDIWVGVKDRCEVVDVWVGANLKEGELVCMSVSYLCCEIMERC